MCKCASKSWVHSHIQANPHIPYTCQPFTYLLSGKQFSLQTHLKCNFRNLTYWECEDDVEKFICVFSFLLYILCVSSQSVISEERTREWTYFNLTVPCSALQFSKRTTWEKCKESSSRTIKQGWSSPAAWCHALTPY